MYCIHQINEAKKEYKFDDYSIQCTKNYLIYDINIRIGDKKISLHIDYGESEMTIKAPKGFNPKKDFGKAFSHDLGNDPYICQEISKNIKYEYY